MRYKYRKKASLHNHSVWSDGTHEVPEMLRLAKEERVDFLAITDHNEIRGSLKAAKLAKEYGLTVVPGVELYFIFKGKLKELLVYFKTPAQLKKFFKKFQERGFIPHFNNLKEMRAFVSEIREMGGAIVLPHPYAFKGFFDKGIPKFYFAGYETINGGDFLHKDPLHPKDKLKFAGADFHFFEEAFKEIHTLLKSRREITYDELFDNLLRKKKTIKFVPRGRNMSNFKVIIQPAILCFSVPKYFIAQYFSYLIRKLRK